MKFDHIGIPTTETFAGEIPLPHLKITVSDHQNNPFGIQWQRYWDDAPYPELVKTVPMSRSRSTISAPRSLPSTSSSSRTVLVRESSSRSSRSTEHRSS